MTRWLDLGWSGRRVRVCVEALPFGEAFVLSYPGGKPGEVALRPDDALAVACAIVRELDVSRLVDVPADVLAGLEGLRLVFDNGEGGAA